MSSRLQRLRPIRHMSVRFSKPKISGLMFSGMRSMSQVCLLLLKRGRSGEHDQDPNMHDEVLLANSGNRSGKLMQIAGQKCEVCGEAIVLASEGQYCERCRTCTHLKCSANRKCGICSSAYSRHAPAGHERISDAILPPQLGDPGNGAWYLAAFLALLVGFGIIGFALWVHHVGSG